MQEISKSENKSLLRFTTVGSVDDGKSTLIGRMLYETNCIPEDQYSAIERISKRRGNDNVDFSLLLDGLSAEREQKITIDAAYRYFTTKNRKFIVADTPGHEQYTRNMITGASTAELAVILIDAQNGISTQSKRHGFIISLLRIPHLIVVVNKMDLVGFSKEIYERIVSAYDAFSEKLDIHDIKYIPVSALKGDNVVKPGPNMSWYDGPTLLHTLENIHTAANKNLIDFRFPVQYVVRPNHNFRGYAGTIVSGTIKNNEEIIAQPSGKLSKIKSIVTYDGELNNAYTGQAVVLTLNDELDINRGDIIVRKNNLPQVSANFNAIICWMDEEPLNISKKYILKHNTKYVKAYIKKIFYKIDVNTLHRQNVDRFEMNDIGRIEINAFKPIFFDPYNVNHSTGSFILIDPVTNHTVAAGMIKGVPRTVNDIVNKISAKTKKSSNIKKHKQIILRHNWEKLNGHKAAVLWITGLSGSGKTTLAQKTIKNLFDNGFHAIHLDGDNVRHGLCGDLGFSYKDRTENIRRIGETAKLFFNQGNIVLCSFISPFQKDRNFVRSLIPGGYFIEIFLKCNINVCKTRDSRGLYKKAENGEISDFTGVSSPYEDPEKPEIIIESDALSIKDSVLKLKNYLIEFDIINL